MRWREPKAVRVLCDCGAEEACDRLWMAVNVIGRDERGRLVTGQQAQNKLDLAPIGWTSGTVAPSGKPLLDASGNAPPVDPVRDTDADAATKVGTGQTTLRCRACSEKARAREAVESAGLRVVTSGGA